MIVEKETEEKICALIRARLSKIEGVQVCGAWSEAALGQEKGKVDSPDHVVVAVAVGSIYFETFTVTAGDMPVAISVAVRQEIAPDGEKLLDVLGPIADLLIDWQGGEIDELSTDNFRVDGVRLDPGDPPVFSPDMNVWRLDRALTVRGQLQ